MNKIFRPVIPVMTSQVLSAPTQVSQILTTPVISQPSLAIVPQTLLEPVVQPVTQPLVKSIIQPVVQPTLGQSVVTQPFVQSIVQPVITPVVAPTVPAVTPSLVTLSQPLVVSPPLLHSLFCKNLVQNLWLHLLIIEDLFLLHR